MRCAARRTRPLMPRWWRSAPAAAKLGTSRLDECTLWVTLEPCAMCAAAISLARMKALRFGAEDPKGGGVVHGARIFAQPTCHHRPDVLGGIGEEEVGGAAARLLRRAALAACRAAAGSRPGDWPPSASRRFGIVERRGLAEALARRAAPWRRRGRRDRSRPRQRACPTAPG